MPGRRGLRPEVRRPGAGRGDHRPHHRHRRRRGPRVPPRPAQRANTRDAHRLLVVRRRRAGPRVPRPSSRSACCRLLRRRPQRRRPRRARRGGGRRPVSTPTRCGGSSTATTASPRSTRRWRYAAEAGITAVPTYVIDGRWSIPGAQDPAVFVQVLRRLAATPACRLTPLRRRPARRRADGSCSSTGSPRPAARGTRSPSSWPTPPRGRRRRRARPRRFGRRRAPTCRRRRAARRRGRAGRRTSATRWAAVCACTSPSPARTSSSGSCCVSATAGIDDRRRAGRAAGAPTTRWRRRSSATASTRSSSAGSPSRCSPRCRRRPGSTTAAATRPPGLASSLRLAGTGTQAPLWDRLAGAGDARAPRRRRRSTPSSSPLAERMAGLLPDATLVVIDGAGHAAHLERPDAFVAALDAWLDDLTADGCGRSAAEDEADRGQRRRTPAARGPCAPSTAISAGPSGAGHARRGRLDRRAAPTPAPAATHGRDHAATTTRTYAAASSATYSCRVRRVAEPHRQRPLAGRRVGRDVAQVVDDEQRARQAPGRAPHHAPTSAGDPLDGDVRRADRRHETEEHEHEQLAEPEVAVRPRPARVEPRRGDRRRADDEQPPRRRRGEHQAGDGGDAEGDERRPLHRAGGASPDATSRTGPTRPSSVPRTPSL